MLFRSVKNNHPISQLEEHLFNQDFSSEGIEERLEHCKRIAASYAALENSIAVLSDLRADKSYIFNGAVADKLGLERTDQQINTIWEEEIYNRIHPDDLIARHIQELHFFMLLKKTAPNQRQNFRTYSTIRMKDADGIYISILHRTLYLSGDANNSLWLALCLYNFPFTDEPVKPFRGMIQNCATGEIFKVKDGNATILSQRETEVLHLVEQGFRSKEIADKLGVSKNTVDRHRQNIMDKLRVSTSFEAIRISNSLGTI